MRDRVKTWYLLFLFWSIFLFGSLTHRCDPPTTTNLMSLLVGWKRHNTIGFPFYRPLPSPINIQLEVNLRNKSLRARFLAPRTVWGERDRAINYVNSHLFFSCMQFGVWACCCFAIYLWFVSCGSRFDDPWLFVMFEAVLLAQLGFTMHFSNHFCYEIFYFNFSFSTFRAIKGSKIELQTQHNTWDLIN